MTPEQVKNKLSDLKCAVIVPFYNNAGSVQEVLRQLLLYAPMLVAVNDGSTDGSDNLAAAVDGVHVVSYKKNRGKGYALRQGFAYAFRLGYRYAITIDADGQHYPQDLANFVSEDLSENTLLVGERITVSENKPAKNSFANKFSNFWFKVETGVTLDDTQSGFRLYPLDKICRMRFVSNRYAFEVEVLVRAVWAGLEVKNIPVGVYYPPATERVSHFRPGMDFFRISVLNSALCLAALLWFWPRKLLYSLVGSFNH